MNYFEQMELAKKNCQLCEKFKWAAPIYLNPDGFYESNGKQIDILNKPEYRKLLEEKLYFCLNCFKWMKDIVRQKIEQGVIGLEPNLKIIIDCEAKLEIKEALNE